MFQMHAEQRSVTAICVVEDVSKCPLGYTPIMRTADAETDADLWKDGIFGRRVTRYVCLSKTQGKPDHIIEDLKIIHERDLPPQGFSVLQHTSDTNQKSFKKKLLCYKPTHFRQNVDSVVDVVVLSKLKSPPDGYQHIGDINGMHLLIRKVSALTRLSNGGGYLPYGLQGQGGLVYPSLHDSINNLHISNGHSMAHRNSLPSADNYPYSMPNSPAHAHLASNAQSGYNNYGTLPSLIGIEGVPFVLREDLRPKSGLGSVMSPRATKTNFTIKSELEIDRDYDYDFRAEREALSQAI